MSKDKRCGVCRKPPAFLLKSEDTSLHWRCLRCYRRLISQEPVIVIGYWLPSGAKMHQVADISALSAACKKAKEGLDKARE